MPRHCSAGGCKSRDNRETRKAGVTFHKLPKGASRRNLWITNSHRKGLWDPQTDFVYFCSKHFTPESFELTGYSGIRRLREDAFPTVFDASLEPKRKGPGRPRKRDAIHLRNKTQAQIPVQDMIQEDNKEAETANCTEVQTLKPKKEQQHSLSTEADVNTSAFSNEAASEAENISLQDACPSPPVPQQSPPLEHPVSPSRFMRRLPPPPGFYLPKEHSYAQLCPLLWRRRYERAMDCLEKALRQLSAARRRENRLRTTLSRLREKRLRRAPQDEGQKTKRDWLASGRSRVAVGKAGGDGSFLIQQEEGEFDMDAEEDALCGNASPEPTDWARCFGPNTLSEEEPGEYYLKCNRAGERRFVRDTRPVSRAMNKNAVLRNGILTSQEEDNKWPAPVKPPGSYKDMLTTSEGKALRETHEVQFCSPGVVESIDDVQLVVLERPLGDGFKTSLHLQSALKLPSSPSLLQTSAHVGLQQVILDGEALQNSQVHNLQPALSDFGTIVGQTKGAQSYREPCQCYVFFVQESTEGQLLLVPAITQDGLKGVDRTDDRTENTILEPQITFHPDLGPITEDEQSHGIETSTGNIISTVVREDVREKLKEHLEGFQLQLSTEYIT